MKPFASAFAIAICLFAIATPALAQVDTCTIQFEEQTPIGTVPPGPHLVKCVFHAQMDNANYTIDSKWDLESKIEIWESGTGLVDFAFCYGSVYDHPTLRLNYWLDPQVNTFWFEEGKTYQIIARTWQQRVLPTVYADPDMIPMNTCVWIVECEDSGMGM